MSENSILEVCKDKTPVSARVNKFVVDQYKEKEIPLSLVVETSLIYFMKLSDKEKLQFLSENLPDNSYVTQLRIPDKKWNDLLKEYFEKLNVPNTLFNSLLSGIAIGAVSLIGGILSSSLLKEDDKK